MKKESVNTLRRLSKLVILVVGLILLVWFIFFSYENCSNNACLEENLKACDKAKFISKGDMIFRYTIKGEEGGKCEVNVELLQGKLNDADSAKLEGHEMTCMLPLGVVMQPESNIGNCHGMLKEGLQDLIIKKLHNYLVQNLGKLNLEMSGLPQA